MRAPRVLPGQSITADLWNRQAQLIDQLAAPQDLDQGKREDETTEAVTYVEVTRLKTTVRVTNPIDANDYVDVDRAEASGLRNARTGELLDIVWLGDD